MEIERMTLKGAGVDLPAIKITANEDAPSAVVIHGIGGNKEEMLGLSFCAAMAGYTAYSTDLRGHGESASDFSSAVFDDVNALIGFLKRDNRHVAVIGHSLGGRLALLSDADVRVGISPALPREFHPQTKTIIGDMRMHRVKSSTDGMSILFDEILAKFPSAETGLRTGDLVIYGSRDVPDIVSACEKIVDNGACVERIDGALHGDIFHMNDAFQSVGRFLRESVPRI